MKVTAPIHTLDGAASTVSAVLEAGQTLPATPVGINLGSFLAQSSAALKAMHWALKGRINILSVEGP